MTSMLLPLAWIFSVLTRCRVYLYQKAYLKQFTLPGFVVSVGNIEVGGTGKSPCVVALADMLRGQGARVAILTRGYRSGLGAEESAVLCGSRVLMSPQSGSNFHADEAQMQAQQLGDVPVIIGRNRYAAAQRYLTSFEAPTHWILDDGFQHLRIKRNFDIVLLNAAKPFAKDRCLPAGRLRERAAALKRADAVILTRAESDLPNTSDLTRLQRFQKPIFRLAFKDGTPRMLQADTYPIESVTSWTLALGIAHPERLAERLQIAAYPIRHRYYVRDHEAFDLTYISKLLKDTDAVLTTEKDYWRMHKSLSELAKPVFVIPLSLLWDDPQSLNSLYALMQSKQMPKTD